VNGVDWEVIALAFGIFALRVLGNTITTIRLVLLTRGKRVSSSVLAFFESLIFAVVIGTVVTNLGSIINLMAYCGGFAVGGYVGLWLEDKLTLGYVSLVTVSRSKGAEVARAVREAGFGATEMTGRGADSEVSIVESIVERHDVETCRAIIERVDPAAFVTVRHLTARQHGYFPEVNPGLMRRFNRP
jgi:uncharacterized protein YebE (UPF0316 family)